MKKITKNITIIALLLAAMLVVGAGQASSAKVKYSKSAGWGYVDSSKNMGSLSRRNYKWKASLKRGPFEIIASMPDGYEAGVPTKVVLKYIYRPKTKLKLSSGRKVTYRQWYGKRRPNGLVAQIGASLGTVYVDDETLKLKSMNPNRARTATFWVNIPCVLVRDVPNLSSYFPPYPVYPTPETVATWGQCIPAYIEIDLLVGRMGGIKMGHTLEKVVHQVTAYVQPTPSSPTPAAPTEPTEPTGSTGSSGPTG